MRCWPIVSGKCRRTRFRLFPNLRWYEDMNVATMTVWASIKLTQIGRYNMRMEIFAIWIMSILIITSFILLIMWMIAHSRRTQAKNVKQQAEVPANVTHADCAPTQDERKYAESAWMYGLIALLFCWIPIVGIILGILAGSRSRLANNIPRAQSGRALGQLAIIISIILMTIGLFRPMLH